MTEQINSPIEIKPKEGLGPINFGFSPSRVMSIWGDHQVWEYWMGGNRNDSLLYAGIIIGFDKCNAFGPLENSQVVDFSIYKTFEQLYFMELYIFLIDSNKLEYKLIENGISFKRNKDHISILSLGLEFYINSDNTIELVNFWQPVNK